MNAFKEIRIGAYVLRFWPSDNGWMCGITPEMMDAIEQAEKQPDYSICPTCGGMADDPIVPPDHRKPNLEWVGLTDREMMDAININDTPIEMGRKIEQALKEKNHG